MARVVSFKLEVPDDLARFKLPKAVDERLQQLLERQNAGPKLTAKERREAEGLVDIAELLTLLRLRAENDGKRRAKTP